MRYLGYAVSGFVVPFVPWAGIAVLTGDSGILGWGLICGVFGAVIAPFGAYVNRNGAYH